MRSKILKFFSKSFMDCFSCFCNYSTAPLRPRVVPMLNVPVLPPPQHLRIQDVKVRDAGDYICRAENSLGRAEATTTLEVLISNLNTYLQQIVVFQYRAKSNDHLK